jgi:hypothetical protein
LIIFLKINLFFLKKKKKKTIKNALLATQDALNAMVQIQALVKNAEVDFSYKEQNVLMYVQKQENTETHF